MIFDWLYAELRETLEKPNKRKYSDFRFFFQKSLCNASISLIVIVITKEKTC